MRTATGETFYFATPEETPAKMHDLLTWYRQQAESHELHPVTLAAEFHHRFVSIHPFDDGNGRMSRLLMNLILMRHGYPITVIKADDRNRYLAALSEADAGEPEPFAQFIAENVEASLRLMIRAARGESIEELGDLDKKLALLKMHLKTREEYNNAIWSLVTQKRIYETVIKFWLENIGNEFARFNDLFNTAEVKWSAHDIANGSTTRSTSNLERVLETTLSLAEESFTNTDRPLSTFTIYFEWNGLLDFTYPTSMGAELRGNFAEFNYKLEFAVYERKKNGYGYTPQIVLDSVYTTTLAHARIHEINHQLANKVYDFIAAKVAEADTPPAQ